MHSLGSSLEMGDLTEVSVASITISNESLTKSGESIVVSGKGMGSTVKVLISNRISQIFIVKFIIRMV